MCINILDKFYQAKFWLLTSIALLMRVSFYSNLA